MTALEIKLAGAAALLVALLLVVGAFAWHEREVGAIAVHTADAKAQTAARALADEQTKHNADVAATAALGARNAQKTLDDYVAAHPQQPVWLCNGTGNSTAGLPKAGASGGGKPSPGPGPAPVPAVLGGDQSPAVDISTDIDALVQAAGRMAVVYSELQQVRK